MRNTQNPKKLFKGQQVGIIVKLLITGSLAEGGEDFFISSTRTSSLRRFGVMLSIIGRINSTHEEPRNCRVPLPDHQLQ